MAVIPGGRRSLSRGLAALAFTAVGAVAVVCAARTGAPAIPVWAKKNGMHVGLVTTTTVTHATPAAFYANHRDREAEDEIAKQTIASGFDLILGGGRTFFAEDLRAEARRQGWEIVETADELRAIEDPGRHVLGLVAERHPPYP